MPLNLEKKITEIDGEVCVVLIDSNHEEKITSREFA